MLYRLFLLDARDRIVGAAEIVEAECDAAAVALAEAHAHPFGMELWDGERLVRLFEREAPPGARSGGSRGA